MGRGPSSDVDAGQGGTLRLYGAVPMTLDPAMVQDSGSASYVVEMYSGLVALGDDLTIEPDLATAWELNGDGSVYTFYLRDGVRFSDGELLTAGGYLRSLERACSPELGSPVALSYLDDIAGVAEYSAGLADEISGIEVIDEHTIRFTLVGPRAYFISKLTHPVAYAVGAGQERGVLSGTGPFRLVRSDDETIELERNPGYHLGAPSVELVTYQLGWGDPVTLYETGQLDIAPVGVGDIERVLDPANPLNDELIQVPGLSVQYVGLNVEVSPFDDELVRRAFVLATDRERLADVVLKGMATPAWGILPPALTDEPMDPVLGYDPELARELLAQSSYGERGLPPIILYLEGDATGVSRSVGALLAMWEENLGVEVAVEATDWPAFLGGVDERRYPMFYLGWLADYPDAHDFLDLLFHSASLENHTGYANPEVDALLTQARQETDAEAREALYARAEEMILVDAAWIPLWHDRDYYPVKPYV